MMSGYQRYLCMVSFGMNGNTLVEPYLAMDMGLKIPCDHDRTSATSLA